MKALKHSLMFVLITILQIVLSSFKTPKEKQKEKYNVLWIVLEDFSPRLSCYGDNTISTPNIDRLAKEGIVFDRAYSCAGVSAPSRFSIITGMYPSACGAQNMRIGKKLMKQIPFPGYEVVTPNNVRCFTEFLRVKGVFCMNASKTDYQFSSPETAWDLQEATSPPNQEPEKWCNFPSEKPFFKVLNFWQTHESMISGWMRENVKCEVDTSKVILPPYFPNSATAKLDLAAQYNNVLNVDKIIGVILKKLEEQNLLDKTIIFFYSDHGDGLPRAKRTVYETGVRVPLIVRFPDKRMAGSRNSDLVYLMDLGPTVMSFFDVPAPSYMNGHDIFSQNIEKRKYAFFSADRFDERTDFIRGISDGNYKYIRYFQPDKPQFLDINFRRSIATVRELYKLDSLHLLNKYQQQVMRKSKPTEELFDFTTDPWELNDLSQDPKYKEKLLELRTALCERMIDIKDMGFLPEAEISEMFWPGGIQPLVDDPLIDKKKEGITLTCKTSGAVIGYKTDINKAYTIYQHPIKSGKADSIYVIATRIGFKSSFAKFKL